jgi:hypothetical protein
LFWVIILSDREHRPQTPRSIPWCYAKSI